MQWKIPKVYAVKHKELDIRMSSRSGGIFTALSDEVLKREGVVYGCVLTENFDAIHVRAESVEERNYMRGSKYIQSDVGNTFKQAKMDLDANRIVLFSGTSCQIAGLKAFLGKEYENLLCIDIVCHGVPSTLIWYENVHRQEIRYKGKCVSVNFRNKKDFGWNSSVETYKLVKKNGKEIIVNSKEFTKMFYNHYILRPSCFKCPYKDVVHPGDITIADYWGIEKAAPGFDDNKGVSLVLINNEKGERIFEVIKNCLEYCECRLEDSMQPPLISPFEEPKERDKFWQDFYRLPYSKLVNSYVGEGKKQKIKRILKKVLGR